MSFRYDYNNKMFITMLILTIIFLIGSIATFHYSVLWGVVLAISFVLITIVTYIMRQQGIHINKSKGCLVIFDDLLRRKCRIVDIKYVELKEIQKERKNALRGFLFEYYEPFTYMSECKYVYNYGRVFNIVIHLKNGKTIKTYFGWMYKEKNEEKVLKTISKLDCFISDLNNSNETV